MAKVPNPRTYECDINPSDCAHSSTHRFELKHWLGVSQKLSKMFLGCLYKRSEP